MVKKKEFMKKETLCQKKGDRRVRYLENFKWKLTLEVKFSKSLSLEETVAPDSTTDDISLEVCKRLELVATEKAAVVDGAKAAHCRATEIMKKEIAIGRSERVIFAVPLF
jgi:hypothetical protein